MTEEWQPKDDEPVHIRWSDFPRQTWMPIRIPDIETFQYMPVRRSGLYAVYDAYFPFMPESRIFKLVLPYHKFKREIDAMPQDVRERMDKSVRFELYKDGHGKIKTRNWEAD